jgi:hypothetical protein
MPVRFVPAMVGRRTACSPVCWPMIFVACFVVDHGAAFRYIGVAQKRRTDPIRVFPESWNRIDRHRLLDDTALLQQRADSRHRSRGQHDRLTGGSDGSQAL